MSLRISFPFPLRPDFIASLELPDDLTVEEAQRVSKYELSLGGGFSVVPKRAVGRMGCSENLRVYAGRLPMYSLDNYDTCPCSDLTEHSQQSPDCEKP